MLNSLFKSLSQKALAFEAKLLTAEVKKSRDALDSATVGDIA
jgi:hypothetical protein